MSSLISKPAAAVSTPKSCLISLPSLFTNKPAPSPFLSIPTRPIKIQLSSSSSSSSSSSTFSLNKKNPQFSSIVALVSAQQEEDNTIVLEEQDEEGELTWENDDSSNPESEGEDGTVEAIGDAGESAGEDVEELYPEPPEEAKLFVGNLPYDIDSQRLAELFNKAGAVEIAEVIINRDTNQSRGFGFVTMSTVEEAEKAETLFNRYDLGGRLLTVSKAAPRGTRPERQPSSYEPVYRVYVGNLPWDFDDERLFQLFSEQGKVINARIVYDRESGRSRGFGFVTLSSEAEVGEAINSLDGQTLGGRVLRVNIAEERPRRGGF